MGVHTCGKIAGGFISVFLHTSEKGYYQVYECSYCEVFALLKCKCKKLNEVLNVQFM